MRRLRQFGDWCHARFPMNRWNIPDWLEREVILRDKACVYCGTVFGTDERFGSRPSWEHIINDARIIITTENSKPSRKRQNRQIPDVCVTLKIRCEGPFYLYKQL